MYLLIFIGIILLYFLRPSWLMLSWIILIPLLGPIIIPFTGITDSEMALQFLWLLWGVYNRAFLLIVLFLIFLKKRKFPGNILLFIKPWAILAVYFVIHSILTHFDISIIYQNVIGALYTSLPMMVMILDPKTRPTITYFFGVIVLILMIQLVMIPFNMEGIIAYPIRYQEREYVQMEMGLVSGTFTRSNAMADFVSIAYLFFAVDYFTRKKIKSWFFIIISISCFILMFLSGSKMPIVSAVIALVLCVILFKRQYILPICSVFVVAIVMILVSWKSIEESTNDYPGVDRIVSGMTNFIESKKGKGEDDSTVKVSSHLINQYLMESPLIGCGYSYKGNERAYPLRFNSSFDLTLLKADATLALNLVEFGIIGLMLYLFYYFSLLKYSSQFLVTKNKERVLLVIFIFFLLFSITEGGLFNRENYIIIFSYIFALQRYNEENMLKTSLCLNCQ